MVELYHILWSEMLSELFQNAKTLKYEGTEVISFVHFNRREI